MTDYEVYALRRRGVMLEALPLVRLITSRGQDLRSIAGRAFSLSSVV